MIIFRPHRGSLDDAMKEVKIFADYDNLKQYVVKDWNNLFTLKDVIIGSPEGDDDRIGWKDVRMVCITKLGEEDYMKKYGVPQCIGHCSEMKLIR